MIKRINRWVFVLLTVIILIFFSGCLGLGEEQKQQQEEYPNAASGGTFSINDKIEYLGVKGVIVTGKIENGIVTLEPLQINNESLPVTDSKAPLLVYGSFDNPTYGHMAIAHYVQRGGGEYDLYDDGQLVATMKSLKGYSRSAYIVAACEPDSRPEVAEQLKAIVIKRYRECS